MISSLSTCLRYSVITPGSPIKLKGYKSNGWVLDQKTSSSAVRISNENNQHSLMIDFEVEPKCLLLVG